MTHHTAQPYAAFRLNLEQQHKRAKDLLKAAKAGNTEALRRLHDAGCTAADASKLAQAQHCVARELRFESWAALKRHLGDMERSRRALSAKALDDDCRTMPWLSADDERDVKGLVNHYLPLVTSKLQLRNPLQRFVYRGLRRRAARDLRNHRLRGPWDRRLYDRVIGRPLDCTFVP